MDEAAPQTNPPPGAESTAQEKARLRRERRAAKIQSGGASRLQAISSLQSGGSHRDVEKDVPGTNGFKVAESSVWPFTDETTAGARKPSPAAPPNSSAGMATPDPDEIDISSHHYTPVTNPQRPSPFAYNESPFPVEPAMDPVQDPMMAMLQQMMGGAGAGAFPGAPGSGAPPSQGGELPPGLAQMLSAMQPGAAASPAPSPDQSSAWIWRVVHSVFALGLAIYMVLQTPFTGSKLGRASVSPTNEDWTVDSSPGEAFKNFFYLFATFEVVLQSSRYFLERGQLQGSGMLSSVAQMLPQPYGGYVRVLGRYSVIYSTVASDAMVVVFVLGFSSWLSA